jgi:pimeloyl-ACP methyl ester carboxylesterase
MNTPVRPRAQGHSSGAVALAVLVCLAAPVSCARRSPPATPERLPPDCSYRYSASVTIHCEQEGSGDETFVLLHGFGTSLQTWHDVRPALARRGRVVMLDLKGFGLSSKPRDGAYSPPDQADIVAAFISDRKLSGIVLVGHSYGGGVAVLAHDRLAQQGRDAVKALMVWGEHDPVVPIANAHRLKAAIARSRLDVIPAAGHVPHEEYPEATLGAILGFLGVR